MSAAANSLRRASSRAVANFYDGAEGYLGESAGFFNQGYWKDKPETQDEAGRALVRLVGAAAGLGPGDRVLDAGIGYGDQLPIWFDEFGIAEATGVTLSSAQLSAAARIVGRAELFERCRLLRMSATALDLPAASFDAVVAVESGHHFDPREAFFREALSVLKRGGRFAACDILPMPRSMAGRYGWMIDAMRRFPNSTLMPRANVVDRRVYARQLEAAGFVNVRVVSIREHVWAPMARRLRQRMKAGSLSPFGPLRGAPAKTLLHPGRLAYLLAMTQMLGALANPLTARAALEACDHGPLDYIVASAEAP